MGESRTELPRKYHDAVVHWQRHNFPDYPSLQDKWDEFFPKDEPFCLCAKLAQNVPNEIEIGGRKGQPKAHRPADLDPESGKILLDQIITQASTEFGSIQQHQPTLARAQEPQDQAWALRVMAEELRHGYQMLHLLTSTDWSPVSDRAPEDMVEEILSMRTGSHILAAFNLDFDSFVDNVVFAAFIDRVGKYQLSMQKVSAYKPYGESMPPMLKEEAFHLAAGVIPMRRWVEQAAGASPLITMRTLQEACTKWFCRGLEMFGPDRDDDGGSKSVELGLKDLRNRQAQDMWIRELEQMLDDLNRRYVRARFPKLGREAADALHDRLVAERGTIDGVSYDDDLLKLPDRRFFRRRGEGAFELVGFSGERFDDVETYVGHLTQRLSAAYLASLDVKHYLANLRAVHAGTMTVKAAIKSMPRLARMKGTCPCSNSVRWVVDVAPSADAAGLNP